MKTISKEEEGKVSQVEMNSLKNKIIASHPSDWSWIEGTKSDLSIVPVEYVSNGPVHPDVTKSTFYFPENIAKE